MRGVWLGVAVLLDLAGVVWVLQGTGVLPGSFMTGQVFWAGAGVVCLIASGVFYFLGLRRVPALDA
jgi:hypothetical protein